MTTREIVRAWHSAMPPFTDDDRYLAQTLVRTLAGEGEPVTTEQIAGILHRPEPETRDAIARLPWVAWDDRNRIVGTNGLSLAETAHRLRVGDRTFFAWCAMDALILPLALGTRARIDSRCPTSGEPVTMTVSDHGVRDVSPPGAMISYLIPGGEGLATGSLERDIGRLCHNIHFFASAEGAEAWTAHHDGTFVLSISDAFEMAADFHAPQLFGVRTPR